MPRGATPPWTAPGRSRSNGTGSQGTTAAFLGAEAVELGPVRPPGPARRHRPPLLRAPRSGDRRLGAGVRRRRQRGTGRRSSAERPSSPPPDSPRAPGSRGPRSASGSPPTSCSPASPPSSGARRSPAGSGDDAIELFATDGPGTSGSNGWLVTGERTATGAPIIAGDPHRFIEDPGVYQQIRLSCPEFDVVGLAVPGVPGIAHFGHTGDGRLGDHQRHGRLPGPLPGTAAAYAGRWGGGARPRRLGAGRRPHRDHRGGGRPPP